MSNDISVSEYMENLKPSTFTVLVIDDDQTVIELMTKAVPDMVSVGAGDNDQQPGIEISRELHQLAEAIDIRPAQAGDLIEHIEMAINDGYFTEESVEVRIGEESLYDSKDSDQLKEYRWALVQNKPTIELTADEKVISEKLGVSEKDDYLQELSYQASGPRP